MPSPILREGTNDADCWNRMIHREYEYIDALKPLAPLDLVIDIGAHIGTYTLLAHRLGSRRIRAFEAVRENWCVAQHNVGDLDGVEVSWKAVVRSDDRRDEPVYIDPFVPLFGDDGPPVLNTGASSLYLRDAAQPAGNPVPTIALDQIISDHAHDGRVAALKIDCEGSEWPILYTAQRLGQVSAIFGEYHLLPDEVEREMGLAFRANDIGLTGFLQERGFTVTAMTPPDGCQRPNGPPIGMFRALRMPG